MNAENTASQAVQTLMDSDKVGYAVASGSILTGIGTYLTDIQPIVSFAAATFGALLSLILAAKHIMQTYWQWKDRQHGHARKDDPPIDEEK